MERQQIIDSIGIWTERYSYYIDLVFALQKSRIEKGYTQGEISFLLGVHGNKISWIERYVPDVEYTVLDLLDLSILYNCKITDFFNKNPDDFGKELVGVYASWDEYGVKYFQAYVSRDNSYYLLYEISEYHLRVHKIKDTRKEIEKCLNEMIENGFFKTGASPLDIFIYCKAHIISDFRPKHLQHVLRDFFKRGSPKLLKKIKHYSKTLYIQKNRFQKM